MNIGNYSSSYGYQAYTPRNVETPQENSSAFEDSISSIATGNVPNDSPMEDVIECGGVWTDNYMLEFHPTQEYFNPENPTITMNYSGVYGKTGNTINYSFEKSYEISLNSIDLNNASRADVLALAYYLELDHSQILESEENKDDPFSKHNFIRIYEKEIAMLRDNGDKEQADTNQRILDNMLAYVNSAEFASSNLSPSEFGITSSEKNEEKQFQQQWEEDTIIRQLMGQIDTDFTDNASRFALLGSLI